MTDAHKITNLMFLVVMQFGLIAAMLYALISGAMKGDEEQAAFNKVRKELDYKKEALKACTEHMLRNKRSPLER